MSLDQDLVRLVREVVKAELNSSRTNATEIVGRGGDTVLSSMGNIFIQPGTNKKAYYHETEIGSGSGTGGTTVKVSANDTTAGYLNGKLVAGANISLTEGSDGGNETLTVALTGGGVGDVYLANDNIFTGDHQTIRGAGGSAANYPTIQFRNSTFYNLDYAIMYLDDTGVLTLGVPDTIGLKLYAMTHSLSIHPLTTDSYDLGASNEWWNEVFAQKYYVDDTSTYISNVAGDMKFFDVANAAGKTLTELVAGGIHSSLSNLDYASAGHTGFFPSSGGALTGDLSINHNTIPTFWLRNASGTPQASLYWGSGTGVWLYSNLEDLYINAHTNTKSILIEIAESAKLTITNTAITAAVDVVLGTNKLRGTAGGGSDVILGDDLSGLKAASTYADIKNIGTITPGSTGTKDLGSSSLKFNNIYLSGNLNQSNLLAGLAPTFTNYAQVFTTNAEITNELVVDQTPTTDGRITANTVGTIVYDLGSSKRIIVTAYAYLSNPSANPNFAIDLSDDNTNFYTNAFERSEAYYPHVTTIGKARYVRLRIQGHASVQTVLNELSIRAYAI